MILSPRHSPSGNRSSRPRISSSWYFLCTGPRPYHGSSPVYLQINAIETLPIWSSIIQYIFSFTNSFPLCRICIFLAIVLLESLPIQLSTSLLLERLSVSCRLNIAVYLRQSYWCTSSFRGLGGVVVSVFTFNLWGRQFKSRQGRFMLESW